MESGIILEIVLELILIICIVATAVTVDKLRGEEIYQLTKIREAIENKDPDKKPSVFKGR
ncbi:MAG: hypothetical protein IJ746_06440 [Ruminococcus sp.]|nr:hypothetical protein [Ruminococcus sp.]